MNKFKPNGQLVLGGPMGVFTYLKVLERRQVGGQK